MNIEKKDLMNYLKRIADKSMDGEIDWKQPNLSTFQWVQGAKEERFNVTIKKSSSPASARRNVSSGEVYTFQVRNMTEQQTEMSLSSKERPEIEEVLAEIFKGAERRVDMKASNVLKKLLGE